MRKENLITVNLKTLLFAFWILIFSVCRISAQTPNWAWLRTGLCNRNILTTGSGTDALGNVYFAVQSGGNVTYNSTFGTTSLVPWGAFLLKCDAGGNLLWAISIDTTGQADITTIIVDASNNVYVAGYFDHIFSMGTTTLIGGV